ncbi:GNAT family N-acetyltransferase, partial [Mesorhizobium sp. M7A.F.Ca.CA.002.09.1.1]
MVDSSDIETAAIAPMTPGDI